MRILNSACDPDRFFASLSTARERALLLDYDGTLAPFRVERDKAVPYPGVRELLEAILEARHTRLVVISGRAARDLVPLLGIEPHPEIWGSHGWERLLPDGTYRPPELDIRCARGLAAAQRWVVQHGLADRCELKPASLALHWRGLEPRTASTLQDTVMQQWAVLAQATGLVPHTFDGGIELRAPGRNKGHAVATVCAELGQGAAIAYLGDDLTDEDAFKAINGRGLGVLVRPELRPTAADVWIQPPEELRAFLARWQHLAQPIANPR